MTNEEKRENIITNTSDSYEIKIGDTVYVISHEYGKDDLLDIAVGYLSEKSLFDIKKTA